MSITIIAMGCSDAMVRSSQNKVCDSPAIWAFEVCLESSFIGMKPCSSELRKSECLTFFFWCLMQLCNSLDTLQAEELQELMSDVNRCDVFWFHVLSRGFHDLIISHLVFRGADVRTASARVDGEGQVDGQRRVIQTRKIILQNLYTLSIIVTLFTKSYYKIGSVDSAVEELKQHLKCRGGAGLLGFGEQQTLCTGHSNKKHIKMHVTCIKRESKGSPTVKLLIQDIASMHWCIDLFGAFMCFDVPSSCQRSYLHIE